MRTNEDALRNYDQWKTASPYDEPDLVEEVESFIKAEKREVLEYDALQHAIHLLEECLAEI